MTTSNTSNLFDTLFGGTNLRPVGLLHFRNPRDAFTGTTLAAARTARDTYFATRASDLQQFANDPTLAIILTETTGNTSHFETYDAPTSRWLIHTDVAQGPPGREGPRGRPGTANVYNWARSGNTDDIPADKLDNVPVEDWAKDGNTDQIPANKLGNAGGQTQSQVEALIDAEVYNWALDGNTDQIPANKLGNVGDRGLNQTEVDARVRSLTSDWAEDGNASQIPLAKLPPLPTGLTQDQVDARVNALTSDWAEQGNSTLIPVSKLANAPVRVDYHNIASSQALNALGTTPGVDVVLISSAFDSYAAQDVIIRDSTNGAWFKLGNLGLRNYDDTQVRSLINALQSALAGKLDTSTYDTQVASFTTSISALESEVAYSWAQDGNTDLIPTSKLPALAGGRTEAQVNAQIDAKVFDWAEVGNTDPIPSAKLTNVPAHSGLDKDQVDARIDSKVYDWAEEANTDIIPTSKLPDLGLSRRDVDARILALVVDWAEDGDTTLIPDSKLHEDVKYDNAKVDARIQRNVEDWAETGNTDAIPGSKLVNAPNSGLTQPEVDDRINHLVSDWAEVGNSDVIPASKIPPQAGGLNQNQVDARVRFLTYDWAEQGNGDAIPASKLSQVPSPYPTGGLINAALTKASNDDFDVHWFVFPTLADWAEAGNTSLIPSSKLPAFGGGQTQAEVNDLIRHALAASVRDNTETGITVTWDGEHFNFVVGEGPPPGTLQISAGWSATATGALNPVTNVMGPADSTVTITTPANPTAGWVAVLECPQGYHFTSIRSQDFPSAQLLNDWTESPDRRRRYQGSGVSRLGASFTLQVIIEANL